MTDASKGLVGFCVLVVVVLSTGCDFLPVGEPNSEVGPIAKPTVYQVGTFEGALADEMAEFLNLVPYDGSRTDAPVVIAGNAVAGLTLAEAAGIKGIYDAQHPVAVVYASLAQIEALQQNVLGNASFQYAFPADVTVADIYGIDKEQDGDMWQWSLFPPASAATSCCTGWESILFPAGAPIRARADGSTAIPKTRRESSISSAAACRKWRKRQ